MTCEGCCPESRVPKLDKSVEGKGEFVSLTKHPNAKVYLSGNPKSDKMVIFHPDIHGPTSGRHTALCDSFAEEGFFVVMPDYFNGDKFVENIPSFVQTHSLPKLQLILDEAYEAFVGGHVRGVFMVGFCWGCWTIFNESKRKVLGGKFRGAACFHPSIQLEGLTVGGNTKALCESVNHPMILVPTEGDVDLVQPGTSFLDKEPFKCRILDHTHQKHGFMTQGDFEENGDKRMEQDITSLLTQTATFFNDLMDLN